MCLTPPNYTQIINLIKAQAAAKATADAEAANARLHSELEQLTLKELRLRAAAEGVDEDAIEDARDGDNPKEDVRVNYELEIRARELTLPVLSADHQADPGASCWESLSDPSRRSGESCRGACSAAV